VNAIDILFEELAQDKPQCFAVKQYRKFKLAAGVVSCKRLIYQKLVNKTFTAYFYIWREV
jgi:hypothetical protein